MEEEKRFKMAVISGAAQALKYKNKNPHATEGEIMQHVTDNAEEILENIDEEI